MEGYAFVVFEGVGGAFDHAQVGVKAAGGAQPAGVGEDFAAGDIVAGDAGEVEGQSDAGGGGVQAGLVALEAADAGLAAGGGQFDLLADGHGAINEGAGYDGAEAADGEAAVHGEAGAAQVAAGFGAGEDVVDGGAEVVQAGAGVGGYGGHRAAGEGGVGQGVLHFGLHQFPRVRGPPGRFW